MCIKINVIICNAYKVSAHTLWSDVRDSWVKKVLDLRIALVIILIKSKQINIH